MSHPTPRRLRSRTTLAALLSTTLLAGVITAAGTAHAPDADAHGSYGTLPTGDGPYDITIAGDFAYVGNRYSANVTVIDTTDWSVVTTVAVGNEPYNVNASPDGSEVWASNAGDGTISIIDTATNTVSSTLTMGGAPRDVLFTNDGATAYVLNSSLDEVQIVNTTTHAFTGYDAGSTFPFLGVLSADESSIFMTVGAGVNRLIRFDLVDLAIDYDSTLGITGTAPKDVVHNSDQSQLWVLLGGTPNSVAVMNPTSTAVIATIPLEGTTSGGVFSESGDIFYATEYDLDRVAMIDTATYEVIGHIATVNDATRLVAASGDVAVTIQNGDVVEILGFEQERLAGTNRFETAVAVSQKAFPSGTSTVFVANGLNFPDALAAGPAAGKLGGSLLLTNPTSLPDVVRDEIVRLNPSTIYVIGGTGAVSASVETALEAIQPNVIRLAGTSRYLTGAAIVEEVWNGITVPEVFIATGRNYPDALSAGAVAAGEGNPVILVDGNLSTVPASTIALITELAPTQITIAGGTGVVSAGIMSQLTSQFPSADVRRLAGSNRYETSTAINVDAYPTNNGAIFATGSG
ncbi:MAG: hypothetical protein RL499_812, partial [Actinomycetota bacterium]